MQKKKIQSYLDIGRSLSSKVQDVVHYSFMSGFNVLPRSVLIRFFYMSSFFYDKYDKELQHHHLDAIPSLGLWRGF